MSAETRSGDPIDILRWQRIDARLTTSGQPTEEQLAALKALNVTHIINIGLHTDEMALADEAASVGALGMTYIHIPVDFEHPAEEDIARFHAAMDECQDKTLHVHCIANLRVSALLYRYERERAGPLADAARDRMDQLWQPGGVWAKLIGDEARANLPHRYAGRDY